MPYIVRTSGQSEPLQWSGVGAHSIGIYELPLNTPIRVKSVTVRLPSGDGNAHSKNAGSKVETVNLQTKKIPEIIADIKRAYHTMTFKVFESLAECQSFIATGKDDYELLGVSKGDNQSDIRRAYLAAMVKAHPDKKTGDNSLAAAINAAYERVIKKAAK